ncbi:ribonuclease Y [Candidatus Dojkabacteria bacterium]|uniref:Ribonuclease Y n=1 Tax=Candidatus Dojkabacteria bacterium TaxID=2099670 RepID=A0A955RL21_9BACT|nr:ribonuclease Y [Candidatus Dojkabacteria bacterium]
MDPLTVILGLLLLVASAVAGYFFLQSKNTEGGTRLSELEAIEKASNLAKEKIIEAEKKASEIEKDAQNASENLRKQLAEQEKVVTEREKKLIDRSKNLDERFDSLESKEKEIQDRKEEIKKIQDELGTKLEEIAKLSKEEAEKELKKKVEKELQDWTASKIRESEKQIQESAEEKAQKIVMEAMQQSAVDYVADTTTTTIDIQDESMKSRIIGKSGRNVRAFERITGVDVIIDESPTEITISCFDPIRREVAAIAMNKLVSTGKINPAAIEETIDKVKKDILKEIKKTGEDMAYEAGINDLPDEVIMMLGRFKYRFSYGQNLVKHTLEVVKLGEYIAKEIGADPEISKLACLLHDLGKVMPQEGKQHHHISAEIARKYFKDNERLANAIEAHHFDIDSKFIEAEVVRIADAISGARPGARKDSYEDYVKRIRALEDIANKHEGVKEAYAIRAGREVRVIVKPESVDDNGTKVMAHDIAKEIEESQSYPGVIKVNVIREVRATEEAK